MHALFRRGIVAVATFTSAASHAQNERDFGLLIIAPDAFVEAMQPYATARDRDLPTRVVALSESLMLGGSAKIENHAEPAADDAERLKRFLFIEWRERQTRFVLLVGDADVMPVRYMCLDRVTPAAFDYAFYPSDLYYADVAEADGAFDDWNAQREGVHASYFGEVRGEKNKSEPMNFDEVSYTPELAVGRWPVSSVEHVRAVADKTLRHIEASKDRTFAEDSRTSSAAMIACGGWIENRPLMDDCARVLGDAGWAIESRYFADDRRDDRTPPPDADNVIALANAGCNLILHSGHGNDDRWEHSISIDSITKMTGHEGGLPVLLSAGCSTARLATLPPYEPYVDLHGVLHRGTNNGQVFTQPPPAPACYQRGELNPTGLGEQMLRSAESGAVAYIGCNTGSQPCGMTLARGFVIAAANRDHEHRQIGECWNDAIKYYIAAERVFELKPVEGQWYPASIFFQGMKFMLFGDPSVRLGS